MDEANTPVGVVLTGVFVFCPRRIDNGRKGKKNMKILRVSTEGICPPSAKLVEGKYYALHHGEKGRGRWEVRFPLPSREFPPREDTLPLDGDYSLVDLHRTELAQGYSPA